MRRLALILLAVLAACSTPREACERDALAELRVLDQLIAETEQTIARGYALEREPYSRPHLELCYGVPIDDDHFGMTFCNTTEIAYRERPVAVDLDAERRKLRSLKARRAEIAQDAARRLALCRQQYPEG